MNIIGNSEDYRVYTGVKASKSQSLFSTQDYLKRKNVSKWESTFRIWANPPSTTEEQRCQNAERMLRDAIKASSDLSLLDISVVGQGSYRANTNVRLNSDVDVRISYNDYFYYNLTDGITKEELGFTATGVNSLSPSDFKRLVWASLKAKFGDGVEWGSKAIKVKENSYRIVTDAVPSTQYRHYFRDSMGAVKYHEGVVLYPDSGSRIINWPDQTLRNGIEKNKHSGMRFKSVIRILKRLRNKMQDEGIAEAQDVASFLIECLVWNAPDWCFGNSLISEDVEKVLGQTWFGTYEEKRCREWGEVNELKYLFRDSQPWTRTQACNFLWAAKQYLGN